MSSSFPKTLVCPSVIGLVVPLDIGNPFGTTFNTSYIKAICLDGLKVSLNLLLSAIQIYEHQYQSLWLNAPSNKQNWLMAFGSLYQKLVFCRRRQTFWLFRIWFPIYFVKINNFRDQMIITICINNFKRLVEKILIDSCFIYTIQVAPLQLLSTLHMHKEGKVSIEIFIQ